MKKKLLVLFALVCIILMAIPVSAAEIKYSGQCGNDVRYSFNKYTGKLTISGTGDMMDLPPSGWGGFKDQIKSVEIKYGVTSIHNSAFSSCTELTSVTLPSTLTSIGKYAFYRCWNLESITLPKNLKSVGSYAFADCNSLKTVTFPANVTFVSTGLFHGCENLTGVTFQGHIKGIANQAFYLCESLTGLDFRAGCSGDICEQAFYGCTGLVSFEIPEGITRIEEDAFCKCTNLKQVTIPETVQSIYSSAFRECKALTYVTIPKSVDFYEGRVFSFSDNLIGITMYSSTVEKMKTWDFDEDSVRYVHIIGDAPNTDLKIVPWHGDTKFLIYYDEGTSGWQEPEWNGLPLAKWGDENPVWSGTCGDDLTWRLERGMLTISGTGHMYDYNAHSASDKNAPWQLFSIWIDSVVFDEGILSVGDDAFGFSNTIDRIIFADSIEEIGKSSFQHCGSAVIEKLPANLKTIGDDAFADCDQLTEIVIPDGVTKIGSRAFSECANLTKVSIPDSVTDIGTSAFFRCRKLAEVRWPENMTEITNFAFQECNIQQIDIPDGVTYIGRYALASNALTDVTLPSGLVRIAETAFKANPITSITIPATVQWIDFHAFLECTALESVYFEGENAPEFGSDVFEDVTATIYYPENCPSWEAIAGEQYGGTLTWVPVHKHDYESIVTAPTCTAGGYTTHTCTSCGDSYTDNLTNATGHTMGPWEITVEPTEEQNGSKSRACANCDYVQTVTITINGIPGDMDDSGTVDVDDVLALLWHVLFPEEYPISVDADFDANGTVDVDDVLALLWHVLFPEEYPLGVA